MVVNVSFDPNLGDPSYGASKAATDRLTAEFAQPHCAVHQIRWGPAIFDASVAAGLAQRGVVLKGYSPFRASNLDDPTLASIADAHSATTAQIIVAWHIATASSSS